MDDLQKSLSDLIVILPPDNLLSTVLEIAPLLIRSLLSTPEVAKSITRVLAHSIRHEAFASSFLTEETTLTLFDVSNELKNGDSLLRVFDLLSALVTASQDPRLLALVTKIVPAPSDDALLEISIVQFIATLLPSSLLFLDTSGLFERAASPLVQYPFDAEVSIFQVLLTKESIQFIAKIPPASFSAISARYAFSKLLQRGASNREIGEDCLDALATHLLTTADEIFPYLPEELTLTTSPSRLLILSTFLRSETYGETIFYTKCGNEVLRKLLAASRVSASSAIRMASYAVFASMARHTWSRSLLLGEENGIMRMLLGRERGVDYPDLVARYNLVKTVTEYAADSTSVASESGVETGARTGAVAGIGETEGDSDGGGLGNWNDRITQFLQEGVLGADSVRKGIPSLAL